MLDPNTVEVQITDGERRSSPVLMTLKTKVELGILAWCLFSIGTGMILIHYIM